MNKLTLVLLILFGFSTGSLAQTTTDKSKKLTQCLQQIDLVNVKLDRPLTAPDIRKRIKEQINDEKEFWQCQPNLYHQLNEFINTGLVPSSFHFYTKAEDLQISYDSIPNARCDLRLYVRWKNTAEQNVLDLGSIGTYPNEIRSYRIGQLFSAIGWISLIIVIIIIGILFAIEIGARDK